MNGNTEQSASLSLGDPVANLRGVGPVRKQALANAGIHTLGDLLAHLPKNHRILPAPAPLSSWRTGTLVTLVGEIKTVVHRSSQRRRGGHLRVGICVDEDPVELEFFNQGYLRSVFAPGQVMRVSGILKRDPKASITVSHFQLEDAPPDGQLVLTTYGAPQGLKSGQMAALIRECLEPAVASVIDPLPQEIRSRHGLLDLQSALVQIHQPLAVGQLEAAAKRLTYNAYLVGALSAQDEQAEIVGSVASDLCRSQPREERLRAVLPFKLTQGQEEALEEILQDMAQTRPMRRLLQGDVGCGKTAVAGLAALNAALCGKQVALLAPTEVLARQLHGVVSAWAKKIGCTATLLVGGMKAAEKRAALHGLGCGEIEIAIGTHALFQKPIHFLSLALVVVDEQHRFGVLQRLKLVRKGQCPHLLAMSATPIPRTLAMTLYSDLKLSSIKQAPSGRKPVATTHHVRDLEGPFDWRGLADKARSGEKCFIVFPGIESENAGFPTLFGLGRLLATRFFKGIAVAAVHGRMNDKDKQEKLEAFRNGDVLVLFATTVIEVGVDVPDARHMVVVGADRFGLAQLHQLRGREGRGHLPGECHLLTKSRKSADSARLGLLTQCNDGFAIAECDLELRGPGDMMGLKQHGPGPLASPLADEELLHGAFADARHLLQSSKNLENLKRILGKFAWRRRKRSRGFIDAG